MGVNVWVRVCVSLSNRREIAGKEKSNDGDGTVTIVEANEFPKLLPLYRLRITFSLTNEKTDGQTVMDGNH